MFTLFILYHPRSSTFYIGAFDFNIHTSFCVPLRNQVLIEDRSCRRQFIRQIEYFRVDCVRMSTTRARPCVCVPEASISLSVWKRPSRWFLCAGWRNAAALLFVVRGRTPGLFTFHFTGWIASPRPSEQRTSFVSGSFSISCIPTLFIFQFFINWAYIYILYFINKQHIILRNIYKLIFLV